MVLVLMFGSPAVRGEWTPLPELLQNCGYSFHRPALHLLVEIPFISCGVTVEVQDYTLVDVHIQYYPLVDAHIK